ncbi:EcsC family protein [Tsuneonella sp. YG55]|uniref:EcsC family protein n=1 Tax=Tsuneonella litorea TaxID=2976475 RepID=A0A9X2VZM9_9SPHN|nr:EcsC family protein [Tsuneonella litorea]MCT2558312.1 EcsC family protein [Tsuneonella litorea]
MDIRKEQDAFRKARPSRLGRGIERLTNPFGKALASVVPNALVQAVVKGIDAAAGTPALARMRHDPADIAAAREAAEKVERLAKTVNGATGAAAGFGGAISAGLDIPASIAIALRNIRDTGRAFGYAGLGEAEKLFRLQILELAALDDPDLRAERIAGIEAAIADDGSLRPVTGDAATPMVDAAVERISRAMALATFRRRIGMVVPLAGSAVGLMVNRSFQSDVSKAARFAFQERRLRAGG